MKLDFAFIKSTNQQIHKPLLIIQSKNVQFIMYVTLTVCDKTLPERKK